MIEIEIIRESRTRRGLARVVAAGALLMACAGRVRGGEADTRPDLDRDILPLLKAHCVKCHGPIKPKGKLNLSSPRSMARGGVERAGRRPRASRTRAPSGTRSPATRCRPSPRSRCRPTRRPALRRWIEGGAEGLPDAAEAAPIRARGRPLGVRRRRRRPRRPRSATAAASAARSIASSSGRSRTAG